MKAISSKGRSPWKVRKGTRAGGIVIPKGAIVVNQGLGKVKIEEDFVEKKPDLPLSMEVEEDANYRSTVTHADEGGEVVTEEHVVVKVEAEIPLSSEETPAPLEEDSNGSLSFYRDEIEALKCTVRDLAEQIDKQNEAMKKQDEENKKRDEEYKKRDEEYKMRDEENKKREEAIKKQEEAIKKQEGVIKKQDRSSEILELIGDDGIGSVDETGGHNPDASFNLSCAALESSSTCANLHKWQKVASTPNGNIGDGKDNQEDHQGNEEEDLDRNDDSSQVLPSSSNRKKEEDDDNPRGNAITRRRWPRNVDRIRSKMRSSKGRERFQCSKCGWSFEFEIMMQDHQRRVHSKVKPSKSECYLCRKVFSSSSHLRRHVHCVHEGLRFKCEYCPREFAVVENVRHHEDTVHKGVTQTHPCKVCGKNLATSSGLQKHMKKIHEKLSGSKASMTSQKKRVERLREKK